MQKINYTISPKSKVPRLKSVDFLRGFAVFIMLEFHFANLFVIRSVLEPIIIIHFLGIVGAPIFLMIVGISVVLSINNRRMKGEPEEKIKKHIIRRGLVIIILHFILSPAVFGLQSVWGWGILSLIGASIVISYYLSKYSTKTIWACAFAVIILSPILRVLLDYQADTALYFDYNYLTITTYHSPWNILAFIRSVLVTPGFPMFPHIFFVIIGVWMGNAIIERTNNKENNSFLKNLIILGILFIIIGIFFEILSNLYPLTPADKMVGNTGYNLWSQGIVFLIFAFFYWIQDIKGIEIQLFKIISFLGEISLTILVLHAFFGWYLLPIFGGPNRISLFSHYVISFAFYCGLWVLRILWEKSNYKYSLKWVIGKLS
ncbi:MAG: heparan-alpha-glucosaminide N-acetyltransferase domain-containing protein [Promethearchaeota archaeon]